MPTLVGLVNDMGHPLNYSFDGEEESQLEGSSNAALEADPLDTQRHGGEASAWISFDATHPATVRGDEDVVRTVSQSPSHGVLLTERCLAYWQHNVVLHAVQDSAV